jgi:Putative prokaryotic signal transducing protein
MTTDRIVEIYSAANAVDARGLCAALEQNGIRAQVVGETLANAAGWLPPGEVVAPRVWVLQSQEALAREVLEEWRTEPETREAADLLPKADEPLDAEMLATPELERPGYISQAMVAVAILCVFLGAWRAISLGEDYRPNWATTRGVLVDSGIDGFRFHYGAPPLDLPIPRHLRTRGDWSFTHRASYLYTIDGTKYRLNLHGCEWPARWLMIRYDPQQPADSVAGPIPSPWPPLLLGLMAGLFLGFAAWRFR